MKEAFDSVVGSFKDRFTNPFLATFFGVWIIRNWYLVYAFFIFDAECTMDDKINYFKNYFKDYNIWNEFVSNLGWTTLILFTTYLLLYVSHGVKKVYLSLIKKQNDSFNKIPSHSLKDYNLLREAFKEQSKRIEEVNNTVERLLINDENQIGKVKQLENDVSSKNNEIKSLASNLSKIKENKAMLNFHFSRMLLLILKKDDLKKLFLNERSRNTIRNTFELYVEGIENFNDEDFMSLIFSLLGAVEADKLILNYSTFNGHFDNENHPVFFSELYSDVVDSDVVIAMNDQGKKQILKKLEDFKYLGLLIGLFEGNENNPEITKRGCFVVNFLFDKQIDL